MADFLMLVLLGVAFTGAVGYIHACADLTRPLNPTPDNTP